MMYSLEGYMNYLLWMAPALLLAMWAQWKVRGTYAAAAEVPAHLSGAAAARHILAADQNPAFARLQKS